VQTNTCLIKQCAEHCPAAPALLSPAGTLDYAALDVAVAQAAGYLCERFPGEGRVLMVGPATPDLIVLLHACFRAGITACPVSHHFPPALLGELLNRLQPRALYASAPLQVETQLPRLEAAAWRSAPPSDRFQIARESEATIVLSSGSTGTPKAVVHAYHHHLNSAVGANENLPVQPGDRWLLSLPLYHVAGIAVLFRCAAAGAAVAIPAPGMPLEQAILETGATHVSVVATQLQRLLAAETGLTALRQLKGVLLGGGPAPEALLRAAHALGLPLVNSYGMTETASQVTATAPGAPSDELSTAGRPLRGSRVTLSPQGEILVAGETLFAGYLEDGTLRRPLDAEGFFATGDRGAWTPEGRLRVLGRQDNLFISGGENIYPEEIEQALCAVEGVCQALVVAVADPEFGQRPVAFVQLRPEQHLEPRMVQNALRPHLPAYKIPRHVFPWPEDADLALKPSRARFGAVAMQLIEAQQEKPAKPCTVPAGVSHV
jgi:o-succinylbenzoate---CoA ligase